MVESFKKHGIEAVDLSEDEFAKSHVRHLVGGRSAVEHERIFRFGSSLFFFFFFRTDDLGVKEFPERPGALGNFLKGMKVEWNISMFHYRNHGAGASRPPSPFLSSSFEKLIFFFYSFDRRRQSPHRCPSPIPRQPRI